MERISSLAVGYATSKLAQIAESTIRKHVIERWSRYRAGQFFEAFCEAIADKNTSEVELQHKLDDLLADDTRSEILFDAYRSVCLTKSKTIGPRVIAVLTAHLVNSLAVADDEESAIFAAAEELSDRELEAFSNVTLEWSDRAINAKDDSCVAMKDGSVCVRMAEESFDSNWPPRSEVSVGPLDLADCVGAWAPKLKRLGLISDDVKERQWDYGVDSDRDVDEPGAMREVTWWLYLSKSSIRLAHLIRTVSRIDAATSNTQADNHFAE